MLFSELPIPLALSTSEEPVRRNCLARPSLRLVKMALAKSSVAIQFTGDATRHAVSGLAVANPRAIDGVEWRLRDIVQGHIPANPLGSAP